VPSDAGRAAGSHPGGRGPRVPHGWSLRSSDLPEGPPRGTARPGQARGPVGSRPTWGAGGSPRWPCASCPGHDARRADDESGHGRPLAAPSRGRRLGGGAASHASSAPHARPRASTQCAANSRPRFGIMAAPSQVDYHDVLRVSREAHTIPEIESKSGRRTGSGTASPTTAAAQPARARQSDQAGSRRTTWWPRLGS
jgi:hypothetical protein